MVRKTDGKKELVDEFGRGETIGVVRMEKEREEEEREGEEEGEREGCG